MRSAKILLVVANRWNATARNFAQRYRAQGVRLLTPADLSRSGWVYALDNRSEHSQAPVGDGVISSERIGGVLTRLSCVTEQDLPQIVPSDRAYVAAEMNGFLLAWLTALACPVLNRPTPGCLSGCSWHHAQWLYAASQLGIPVEKIHRRIDPHHPTHLTTRTNVSARSGMTVTLVGSQCFGAASPVLLHQTRALARVAGVDLLAVQFAGPDPGSAFVGASLWPDITDDRIAGAVLRYLQRASHGSSRRRSTRMILLWGIPEDTPLVVVQSALEERGAPVLFLDQHAIRDTSLDVCVGSEISGVLRVGSRSCNLEHVSAAYVRPYESSRFLNGAKRQTRAVPHGATR